MMKALMIFLFTLMYLLMSEPCQAAQAGTSPLSEERREALQQEMEEARHDMQEAARRLARLSAMLHEDDIREPVVQAMRVVRGPRLGIRISASDEPSGVRVDGVVEESAAAEAGLQVGDIITAVNNRPLGQERQASRILAQSVRAHQSQSPLVLEVMRNGNRLELEVELDHAGPPRGPVIHRHMEGVPGLTGLEGREIGRQVEQQLQHLRRLGDNPWMRVRLMGMNPGLADYFGTDSGVLVLEVPADSELALQAGDVIQAVNDETVQTPRDMIRAIRGLDADEEVILTLFRQGQSQTLRITGSDRPLAFLPPALFEH
ncbi:PDZ domain-containing protein [Natronospira bacteriovora]|uniref:PDZ domain-containing protein n=1 Tax=Natronospira bacteriovora TaxID=3069753 RepID=A0ABU0W7V4_9GAMM|nr:PDZ domain-containing protein [Natronospira sp. AB-CW4]MDQ2070081.1 PDZ domain-containing protein [Natronospira sp. AB-CW4]